MKVVILAGGKGSRISYYTQKIPKPMIKIGGIPMLSHIMSLFKHYGYNDFLIAAGFKKKIISDYYRNSKEFKNLKVIDTGLNTQTGGRILKLKKYLKNENYFFMTYGDGITNININRLQNFHIKNNKIATVTAVRPPVKFGELKIEKNKLVSSFLEKPSLNTGWINGGFFVLNKDVFKYIKNYQIIFEREPMINLSKKKKLIAFKHDGYWKCMDNLKEKNDLEEIYKRNKTIWNIE
ncbi:sugar phosphate nucleotidyltransferase [Candidatus Pelagibacter sp.]|nr:sugar phosphate nucleotidyltransferase [Candidatus Pelagibacter sp.]